MGDRRFSGAASHRLNVNVQAAELRMIVPHHWKHNKICFSFPTHWKLKPAGGAAVPGRKWRARSPPHLRFLKDKSGKQHYIWAAASGNIRRRLAMSPL